MNSISFFKALLMKELEEKDLPGNQEKIAQAAEPKDKITAADFAALRAKKDMKEEDHEVSMASNSLESIIKSAMELKAKMGDQEKDIPAWIQDHITNAENYINQASKNYHEYHDGEHDVDELPDGTEEEPVDDMHNMSLAGLMENMIEEKKKPSAGLTKKEKSAISKKAKAGKDIGKKGKGFEKIAKAAAEKYGSKERGEKVAAAAMWKSAAKKAK
jgi:hypothetical protein